MSKQKRWTDILEILKTSNGKSFKALAGQLNVSEMTIRRDVKQLNEQNLVKLVSGAVLLNSSNPSTLSENYSLAIHARRNTEEKEKIGKAAAALVQPNDVIFIDIGTTTTEIIRHLPQGMPIVAVCCTVNALFELQQKGIEDIIFLGGHFIPDLQMFESPEGIGLLSRIRVNKAFLSAAGVHEQLGITCINDYEVETKTAALQSSLERVLMVDSEKFGLITPAYFAKLHEIDAVVTDDGLTQKWRNQLEEQGVALHISH